MQVLCCSTIIQPAEIVGSFVNTQIHITKAPNISTARCYCNMDTQATVLADLDWHTGLLVDHFVNFNIFS